jgi:KaiC/GvpD/RAD55 family RecA-like ATPase
MHIPGLTSLIDREETVPMSILLLLTGPPGVGKTMYCRQFLEDGLIDGDYCIYISSNLTDRQFRSLFSDNEKINLTQNSKFINPYTYSEGVNNNSQRQHSSNYSISASDSKAIGRTSNDNKLSLTLTEIHDSIVKIRKSVEPAQSSSSGNIRSIRLIIDSLTHLLAIFGESAVLKFITDVSFLLKDAEAKAIFTLTTTSSSSSSNDYLTNSLSPICDGIIEMRLEDHQGSITRSIRILSIKGVNHNPSWINFRISNDGHLVFADQSSSLTCMLCGKAIFGTPIIYSELPFDSQNCIETYKKLAGIYGSNIAEIGLPSVINVNFFFIDIVSLSDPSLSVKKQIEKIEVLNKLIGSCDAFSKTDKKIIFPTGDGMAIGFLLDPELPLQLSTQLHQRLRIYNRGKKSSEDTIEVRIGLSSGPVFMVSDIKHNQNVWGPGIILARRVMDIGDNLHILLADRLAEELIALKDEYRKIIKPISSNFQIKHGQVIKLYSAYAQEFGNSELPTKLVEFRRENHSAM